MREYSDYPYMEFAEIYKRVRENTKDKIKMTVALPRNLSEIYTVKGNIAGIDYCSLIIKNVKLDRKK